MANKSEVKVGQVWLDWDKRFRGPDARRITVMRIQGDYAYCVSGVHKVRIKLSRFKPTSTGYKLFQDVPKGVSDGEF